MDQENSLLKPLQLGKFTLKNRIVFGPHRTNRVKNNCISDWNLNFYHDIAKGGAALIVVEAGCVLPFDYPYEKAINVWAEGSAEGYRKAADLVHRYDALMVAQLTHFGGQGSSSVSYRELWAPSPVPEVNTGEVPKVMEEEDIEQVIAGFASSAEKVCAAGLDGVEINAGQFSLLRQFLSPLTNFRTDSYGGSMENRARFCVETLRRVRQKIGSDSILGLRLCGDEYAPWGGLTPEQAAEIARYLVECGSIDYVTVEVGSIFSSHMTMASMRVPENYAVGPAMTLKNEINIPVCAAGSNVSTAQAVNILRDGLDMVEMTRALIADPLLPLKYSRGLDQEIKPCILCNQGCFTHSGMNPPLLCDINPAIGYGKSVEDKVSPEYSKKVYVIGGGPAGLEAAAVAAARGHKVILFEKHNLPGGRLRIAAKIQGNSHFQQGVDYLFQNARKQGVEFQMNSEFSLESLAEAAPDVIILATGSNPSPAPFAIDPDAVVIYPEEVLEGSAEVSGNVLVVDLQGSWPAIGSALSLVNKGCSLQIVSPDYFICSQLAANGEFVGLYQTAFGQGIKFIPQTEVVRIRKNSVEVKDKFSKESRVLSDIDYVVLAAPNYPNNKMYQSLQGRGIEIWTAGDCVAPRNYGSAVREGFQTGISI